MFDKLFERFPNVRVASVENGSEFLGDLFNKLRSTDRKMPGYFGEDPVESYRRNVWMNPFWEDDVDEVVELMGAERVIFGSDWPHIEGMPRPLDYVAELKAFDDATRQRILRDNAANSTRGGRLSASRNQHHAADGLAALDVRVRSGGFRQRERAVDEDFEATGGDVVDMTLDHLHSPAA